MFKKILSILVLFTISVQVFGQSKKETEIRAKFWNSNSPEVKRTEIPEKWKDESAVILYKNNFYGYTNNGKKMYNPSSKHYRIKLQDIAAVEKYAEFSFEEDSKSSSLFFNLSKESTTIGIKIIKPDGKEQIIDVASEAVAQDSQKKIAIPGLEIGDILDVYVYEDDYKRSFSGTHLYPEVEKVLSEREPVVFSRLALEVENDYFLNMQSYNGAPEIFEEETERRSTRRYVLEARDIEKSDFPRWSYPLAVLPSLKFQVIFALKAKNEYYAAAFLSDDDAERKDGVTKEEIFEYYEDRFSVNKKRVKDALRYAAEKDNGTLDKRAQLEEAFYYARHNYFNQFIEFAVAVEENIISPYFQPCDSDAFVLNERDVTSFVSGLAKALEIDYDIVIATADYNGSIDDMLLRSNVSQGVRLNFEKPLYIFGLTPHTQLDFFPENLEGTKVYTISVKKGKKLDQVTTDVLPESLASDNVSIEDIKIEIVDDFEGFKVDRRLEFTGHFKTEQLARRTFFGDFLDEEFERYNTAHFYHCKKRQKKSGIAQEEKLKAVMSTYRKNKEKRLQEIVSSNLDAAVDDYSYTPVQTARYSKKPLIIDDSFTLKADFIKKAGPNYIVEVGKFIGGQVQLEKEELERALPINLDHAKKFSYKVSIKIPEGYEISGLDKLQRNVANSTGSFMSTAVIENGSLIYTTEKEYSKRSYDSNQWPDMVSWLQEGYDFSQVKVLFKKG